MKGKKAEKLEEAKDNES